MTHTLFLTTAILTALAAAPDYASGQHGVPWYLANRVALQSELAACAADPGNLANTPDCVNANAAQKHVDFAAL
jgi:hypothetical protein